MSLKSQQKKREAAAKRKAQGLSNAQPAFQPGFWFGLAAESMQSKTRPAIILEKIGEDAWLILPSSTQSCHWMQDEELGCWFDAELSKAAPNRAMKMSTAEIAGSIKCSREYWKPGLLTAEQLEIAKAKAAQFESYQGLSLIEMAELNAEDEDIFGLLKKAPNWRSK